MQTFRERFEAKRAEIAREREAGPAVDNTVPGRMKQQFGNVQTIRLDASGESHVFGISRKYAEKVEAVQAWVRENATDKFKIRPTIETRDGRLAMLVHASFANPDDAFHFRMRWA